MAAGKLKSNPIIRKVNVSFRTKTGKFTKPERASYFTFTLSGKKYSAKVEGVKPKTRAAVLEFAEYVVASLKKEKTKTKYIIGHKVQLRTKDGRFSSLEKAAYFNVYLDGKVYHIDIPKFRTDVKEKVKAFIGEMLNELTRVERHKEIVEAEKKIQKKVKKVRGKRVTATEPRAEKGIRYSSKVLKREIYSKRDRVFRRIVSVYYYFETPYEISIKREPSEKVMGEIYGFAAQMLYRLSLKIKNKKGWRFRIRILGQGSYHRQYHGTGVTAVDLFGFSMRRSKLPEAKHLLLAAQNNLNMFMEKVYGLTGKGLAATNYFMRLAEEWVEENLYDLVLFIPGILIELAKDI